jgi:S-adenosylmethionine decarboxylase
MLGEHYLLDLYNCDSNTLNDENYLKQLLEEAAKIAGATLLKTESHKFEPCGVTAFCLLAESHISIHTWPEKGQAAVDVFTCGNCSSELAGEFIAEGVKGYGRSKQLIVRR